MTASVSRLPRMGQEYVSTPLKTVSSSPLWVAFLKDFIVLLLHHKKGPASSRPVPFVTTVKENMIHLNTFPIPPLDLTR